MSGRDGCKLRKKDGFFSLGGRKEREMLPEPFLVRMKQMLGEEYGAFLRSYEEPETFSLRINPLKAQSQELAGRTDFLEEAVDWEQDGFYYRPDARPGRHPYHEAGVYYIQEASAMAPAAALGARPGERILDLCAAPGGKSARIGADLKGEGLLVCNEIHPARARILSENVERMGISNALVLSHEPAYLARRFPEFFHRVLVDAPCSGEGMFRKSEQARREWSPEKVAGCARRQADILDQAAQTLRLGGRLVYSTCTFSREENEETVEAFLQRHREFELEKRVRLWPHKQRGEGHFLASLRKCAGTLRGDFPLREMDVPGEKGLSEKECAAFLDFQEQYLSVCLKGTYVRFGDQLYLLPRCAPDLKGLKVLRPGLHLGTFKKERFEPAHALALFLKPQQARNRLDLSCGQAVHYLKGETLAAGGEKGWYLITVDGYSLGWGKLSGGIMKNHYPRGLRKTTDAGFYRPSVC